jgi:glutamate synthase domain-containing protein 2
LGNIHSTAVQIASGRFGITAETINATNLLEIKVGQVRSREGGSPAGA